jgi:hypothetical protein
MRFFLAKVVVLQFFFWLTLHIVKNGQKFKEV